MDVDGDALHVPAAFQLSAEHGGLLVASAQSRLFGQ